MPPSENIKDYNCKKKQHYVVHIDIIKKTDFSNQVMTHQGAICLYYS